MIYVQSAVANGSIFFEGNKRQALEIKITFGKGRMHK